MAKKTPIRKPEEVHIVRECEECFGSGEIDVHCEDCGQPLTRANVADPEDGKTNPWSDDLCLDCAKERHAEDDSTVPLASTGQEAK